MKILIVNKFDTKGGAAIAANRLTQALKLTQNDVKMLVEQGNKADYILANNFFKKNIYQLKYILSRLLLIPHLKDRKDIFSFDLLQIGTDITKLKAVKQADIIHLHWVNFAFLSLKNIEKLIATGKQIVITLHDTWLLTGGCFITRGCEKFKTHCDTNCLFLKEGKKQAQKLFAQKLKVFDAPNLHTVAISSWIRNRIIASPIIRKKPELIANPIDTNFFKPTDKIETRQKLNLPKDKFLIGFSAFNITNPYKGGKYLIEALIKLKNHKPDLYNQISLLAIGRVKNKDFFPDDLDIIFTGYIDNPEVMRDYYNAMDIFALPSLSENLPLVIQESMSCNVPVVAFKVGGIVDLIDHKENGYMAKYKDAEDFMNGIIYLLQSENLNPRQKIVNNFSYKIIAEKMINFYQGIIKN